MTDYNDGKWHGWNGGECPVHPKTRVIAIEENGGRWTGDAGDCDWANFRGAFRVIKAHVEPRVIWVNEYACEGFMVHSSKEKAKSHAGSLTKRIAVRYVEQPE